MSDILRMLYDNEERLKQTETRETPPLYPPFISERLIPFPLASSANPHGYFGQPWPISVLAFYCTVYVITTNDGANFWTINLNDSAGTTVASVTTSAIAANTATRLSDLTIVQPASTSTHLTVIPTATLAPGDIYVIPSVAWLRTGN